MMSRDNTVSIVTVGVGTFLFNITSPVWPWSALTFLFNEYRVLIHRG